MARIPKNAAVAPIPKPAAPDEPGVDKTVPEQPKVAVAEPTRAEQDERNIRLRVVATRLGYDGEQRRYPAGHDHKMAGQPFYIGFNHLPKGKDGRIKRDQFGNIVLPSWMELYNDERPAPRLAPEPPRTNKSGQVI